MFKNKKIKVKVENQILSIQHSDVGSIKHYISLLNGRCTFYTSEYMRDTCKPSLNVAATYDEVEKLRDVFNEILSLMPKNSK